MNIPDIAPDAMGRQWEEYSWCRRPRNRYLFCRWVLWQRVKERKREKKLLKVRFECGSKSPYNSRLWLNFIAEVQPPIKVSPVTLTRVVVLGGDGATGWGTRHPFPFLLPPSACRPAPASNPQTCSAGPDGRSSECLPDSVVGLGIKLGFRTS